MPAQFKRNAPSLLHSNQEAIRNPFSLSGTTFARQNFTSSAAQSLFSVRPDAFSFGDTQFVGMATTSNPALLRLMKFLSLG